MASQTSWKRGKAPATKARSPSPASCPQVDWFPDAEVDRATVQFYQRLNVRKKRRHEATASGQASGHGRFAGHNGAMDALASTALGSGGSPTSQHRLSASAADIERPSKRMRSDYYRTAPATSAGRRPTTSYEQSTASKLEDAQLLLDFVTSSRTSLQQAAPSNHNRSQSYGSKPSFVTSPTRANQNGSLPYYQSPFDRPQTSHTLSPTSNPRLPTLSGNGKVNGSDKAQVGNLVPDATTEQSTDVFPKDAGDARMEVLQETQVEAGEASVPASAFSTELVENVHTVDAGSGPPAPAGAPSAQPNEAASTVAEPGVQRGAADQLPAGGEGFEVRRQSPEQAPDVKSGLVDLISNPNVQPLKNESSVVDVTTTTTKKGHTNDIPQVCAACNFHRNNLTLETENEATSWISCDGCNNWFHFACAGFKSQREVRAVDKFRCKNCKTVYGPTTYVRKSARAHAPIDYAELNQGVVKTSEESPEHHYIKPIKEGLIKFTPETFARIRPELVTSEFWLRGEGMKEPVVIPAEWNPRPRKVPRPEDAPEDVADDPADDGVLHDQTAFESDMADSLEYEQVMDEGQDLLDMVIPQDLTVRRVAELYGPEEKIEVIDVKSQNGEDKRWNMRKWADYYESTAPNKPVRNVISLEVSQSKLGRLIRRPKVVRELDLQDAVWPTELAARGDFPKVQFYCLMSVADCYTDFHIDFGGSSVYYHILKGKKTFFFIPPTDANLKKYEDWCNSEAQNYTFLGDQTKICYRVDLGPGDTMLIPAGWIHAVWTPEDSLVIGGNFLTRQNYSMQIRVTQIEKATKVPKKFRYPYFQKIMWYTMTNYLSEDPIPQSVIDILLSGKTFERSAAVWESSEEDDGSVEFKPGSDNHNARFYAKCELDGLPELARYLQRTAYIVAGYVTDGVSSDTKRAVQRSIPREYKQHGNEPIDCVRKFAMWCAWKRGNEYLPHWAYPDHVPEVNAPEVVQKKLSAAHIRRLEREAAMSAQRVSDRPQREKKQPSNLYNEMMAEQEKVKSTKTSSPSSAAVVMKQEIGAYEDLSAEVKSPSVKKESQSKKRKSNGSTTSRQPACETCRKGRRACKHRDLPSQAEKKDDPSSGAAFFEDPGTEGEPAVKTEEAEAIETTHSGGVDHAITPSEVDVTMQSGSGSVSQAASPIKEPTTPGRAKACADCRKSKRRCIHDEHGRQDPIKMAQVSQTRPAAKKKRLSEGAVDAPSAKLKKKVSADEDPAAPSNGHGLDNVMPVAPMLAATSIVHPATQQPTPIMPSETLSQAGDEAHQISNASVDSVMQDVDDTAHHETSSALVSPPESAHTDHERTASPAHSVKQAAEENGKARDLTPPTTVSEPRSRRASQIPANKVTVFIANSPSRPRSRALSTASADSVKQSTRGQAAVSGGADEDTMKLIHEMMAEERGLRARRESKPT